MTKIGLTKVASAPAGGLDRRSASDARGSGDVSVQEIGPGSLLGGLSVRPIWEYRELLFFLTWRDLKVRYQQTFLGVAWAILQPLLTMLVFSLFFGRLAGLESRTGGVPYPIYVYAGLLPWTFFANAVTSSGNSLVGNANLITKIYFPRLIIPLAAVAASVVDLLLAGSVLVVMMFFYGTPLSGAIALAPIFVLGALIAATGVGALISALMVRFRDFRYVVPFMLQIWFFVTPVIYPSSIVPERWRWVLSLNPMSGLVEGFRTAFLGGAFDRAGIALCLAVSMALLFAGALYFRSVERRFADVI